MGRDGLCTSSPLKVTRLLADSHVHFDRYSSHEISGMLRRAHRAGVTRFLAVGVDLSSSHTAVQLARKRRGIVAAVGVHPNRVGQVELDRVAIELAALATSTSVRAIGEVGLDSGSACAPLEAQTELLGTCLDVAYEAGLPLALHVVGAHDVALDLLRERVRRGRRVAALVHYFVGDSGLLERYLNAGCWISVGKPVTHLEHPELRDAMAMIPLDRLLLETDTYPLPGRTTEPRDVAKVCAAVAEIRQARFDQVADSTTANFELLFGDAGRDYSL